MVEITLTRDLVLELAKASRIILSEKEINEYTQQLSVILDAFKELDEVLTDGVKASYHPIELVDRLREDKPKNWQWDSLTNVENREERYLRGPKIK